MSLRQSKRQAIVKQSEIRAMTLACNKVNGINMSQGICDLEVPASVVEGAVAAMHAGRNIYTPCDGLMELRQAVADKMKSWYGLEADPETEVLISVGATGVFYAVCLALLDPGDEVILFEPYYGYHRNTLAALGCGTACVRLDPPDWEIDPLRLEAAVTKRTRAIILNTPANPSGKVLTRDELLLLREFAEEHDLAVITDEIYSHFVYDGREHIPPATIPEMRDRTITISGLSKVFSITGWRIGFGIMPAAVHKTAAQLNDLVYICAPAPLQLGGAAGLAELGPEYYAGIAEEHRAKRDRFCGVLTEIGLTPYPPQGSYYVLADISRVPGGDDKERVMHILEKTGVASVPGRAFYHDDSGRDLTRFCFAKKPEVLAEACERISRLSL